MTADREGNKEHNMGEAIWLKPYTVTTWEDSSGDFLIEKEEGPHFYIVKQWGLDAPVVMNGEEIPQQWGWQTVETCGTLKSAKAKVEALIAASKEKEDV